MNDSIIASELTESTCFINLEQDSGKELVTGAPFYSSQRILRELLMSERNVKDFTVSALTVKYINIPP